ncbi:hypothetical protein [Sphingomonas sp.]|jgi:hypothetical protein|uniref:hypothetical protein n=1 Tax=Sphingomonas sp. TaxID=28214 RepID=UPI002EDB9DFB
MMTFAVATTLLLIGAPAQASADTAMSIATCVADSEPRGVRKLLSTLPGSDDEARASRKLAVAYDACRGTVWYDFADARALLAVAIMAGSANRPGSVAASPWYASAISGRSVGVDYSAAEVARQQYGTCIAAAAPSASAQLVMAAPGSAEERAAIGALKPVLGGCIVQGQTVKLTASNLRLMLAEPLYHATAN